MASGKSFSFSVPQFLFCKIEIAFLLFARALLKKKKKTNHDIFRQHNIGLQIKCIVHLNLILH